MKCRQCNNLLLNKRNRFCNSSCAAIFNNKGKTRNSRNPDNWCKCGRRKSKEVEICLWCTPRSQGKTKAEYNNYQKAYQLNRYHQRKELAFWLIGEECTFCHSTESLEIDHIDSSKKEYDLGKVWSISDEKWWREILKCQPLCRKCHVKKSRPEISAAAIKREKRKRNIGV